MKSKIIKKLIVSSLCLSLCLGLIQTNVMAVELSSGKQASKSIQAEKKQSVKQNRKDAIISDKDQEAALSNKLSSKKLIEKYGSKGSDKPSKLITNRGSKDSNELTNNKSITRATSSTYGSNSLDGSFRFVSGLYGGNQNLLHGNGPSTGCGPIAGCNILAYHAKYYDRSDLYPYSWTLSDWKQYQNDLYDIKGGIQTVNRFQSMLTFYAYTCGYDYRISSETYYRNNDSNLTSLCNFVKDQIDSDNPVAILLGTNTPGDSYEPSYAKHWITVTGYDFEEGNTDITVSSWGKRYTLSLAELLANRTWVSAVYAYEN